MQEDKEHNDQILWLYEFQSEIILFQCWFKQLCVLRLLSAGWIIS